MFEFYNCCEIMSVAYNRPIVLLGIKINGLEYLIRYRDLFVHYAIHTKAQRRSSTVVRVVVTQGKCNQVHFRCRPQTTAPRPSWATASVSTVVSMSGDATASLYSTVTL